MNGVQSPLPTTSIEEVRYGLLSGPGPVSRKRLWLAAATLLFFCASRQTMPAEAVAPSHFWRVLLLLVFADIMTHSKDPATSRWAGFLVPAMSIIWIALTIISIQTITPPPVLRDISLLETFVLLFLTLFSFTRRSR
ncbi:hypothetical protein DFJ73DRAFT_42107 [Zopfochytrium polystomum]|nr:hypothetical protein DFJ73DRAFT_42107 [Zopfochytrium polystomum]